MSKINKSKLAVFFQARPEIEFAYLFGSYAREEARESSDVDIACYLDDRFIVQQRSNISLDLINGIIETLDVENIDLVILNDAPLELQYAVMYDGDIVYEQDNQQRVAFEVKTMDLFFDRQFYIKRHIQMHLTRIAAEGIL